MSGVDDLFGSDEDEPQQAPKEDKKANLLALVAAKKREREQEEAAGGKKGKPSKKHKGEKKGSSKRSKGSGGGGDAGTGTAALLGGGDLFGDDEDEDDEDWAAGAEEAAAGGDSDEEGAAGARDGLSRRQQELADRAAAAAEREAGRVEVAEDDERMRVVTEEDRAFIDDDGVAPEEQIDWGDEDEEQNLAQFEEAEEAGEEDELEAIFSKKKKRDGSLPAHEAKAIVDGLLSAMEVAAEDDMRAYEDGKPAVAKLRLLKRVRDVLSTKRLHGELLDGGVLGVLKAWIEPMHDGTLPNAQVRETVLRLLHQLPVDCSMEDRKEQLKKSGLGRVVMFLFKLPDETANNRRLAKELVERWSRPILAPSRARDMGDEERDRILLARQQRQAKAAAAAAAATLAARGGAGEDEDGEGPRQPKFGEPGFRFHAAIPQAAALDYVKAPAGRFAMPEKKAGGKGSKEQEHKLAKKLGTMAKAKRVGRAAVASVEGRNVTIQH